MNFTLRQPLYAKYLDSWTKVILNRINSQSPLTLEEKSKKELRRKKTP
jgi:hypothetical protein